MDQKPPETQQPSQSFLFAAIPVRHPVMWEKGTQKTAITLTRDATIHPKTQPGTSLGLPNLESASSSIRQRGHSNIMIANVVRDYPQKEHKILDLCQSMKVTEISLKSVFLTRKTKSCISVDLGCCSPSLNGTSECMSAGNKWCVHSRSDDVRIYLFYTESVLGAVLLCLAEACLVGSHQQQLRTHKHTQKQSVFLALRLPLLFAETSNVCLVLRQQELLQSLFKFHFGLLYVIFFPVCRHCFPVLCNFVMLFEAGLLSVLIFSLPFCNCFLSSLGPNWFASYNLKYH